jgi:AcrR family transcriptional regulator
VPRLIVTRDDYFALALDILGREGHTGLRIGALCRRAGVTAGSFYHHFGSLDGFVDALLEHWEREKTRRVLALAAAEPDAGARLHRLEQLALGLPHEAETAIRAWAHVNPAVAAAQRRVDIQRHSAVHDAVRQLVPADAESERLATMAMSMLVGFQQWRTPVDADELARLLALFESMLRDRAGLGVH